MSREDLYQLTVSGNVLCVKLDNVWSQKVVLSVLAEVKEAVRDIQHQPWAAYVDMRDWIMPTMEALEDFKAIYQWCADNNQTHEATVCKFATQQRITQDSSGYNANFHYYTSRPADAEAWLKAKGFSFTVPDFLRPL